MVGHSEILLSKCAQFREQGKFIDVGLKVGEEIFSAHRIVLAASSDYFHAMFAHGMKESNQEVIELKDENISAAALKIVLDSIYSGDLQVNDENIFEVLVAADHLQVTSVVQWCCDYLQTHFVDQLRFDVQTYCRVSAIADRHGLKDLQEATQTKMASAYKEICESEKFLSHVDADQYTRLLCRDDLSAPSETFTFKSVMQWIKHKKEERMEVAAKVIGAVRLGLVDIKALIEELHTEEMQTVPEIHTLLFDSAIYHHSPSNTSKFATEKAKLRSTSPVIVAIRPQSHMMYFDVEEKQWKQLSSLAPVTDILNCYCAETVGRQLFVAGNIEGVGFSTYCYDIETNKWQRHEDALPCGEIRSQCTVGDYMYAVPSDYRKIPQRYSFPKRQWQSFAKFSLRYHYSWYHNNGATVLHSKLYVLSGLSEEGPTTGCYYNALLHCFDPVTNLWKQRASTCYPHFESTLFSANDRLCVAGGYQSLSGRPPRKPAPVEVLDEENNKWSVLEQKHIPENNLGAVEVEGRVYFIINNFPFDSGIRIPPGEVYPVYLGDWKNLGNVANNAVLCYVPLKRDSLQAAD